LDHGHGRTDRCHRAILPPSHDRIEESERGRPIRSAADVSDARRARPRLRCLLDDLGIDLPDLGTDLDELDDPWIEELRRIAPTSPTGQKRVLAIDYPLVYRLRVSSERGVTWLDEDGIVWLCAVRRREEGSDQDAFEWFAELHRGGRLLRTDDDRRRDQAEEALRSFRRLGSALFELVDAARADAGLASESRGRMGCGSFTELATGLLLNPGGRRGFGATRKTRHLP
jgi:hypothetical protein